MKCVHYSFHKQGISSPMPSFLEMLYSPDEIHFELTIDEDLNENKFFTKENIEKALKTFTDIQKGAVAAFNDIIPKYAEFMNGNKNINFCLGGNAGFWSKTLIYALAPDKQSAIDILREYFSYCFDKGNKGHKHKERDKKTAPHALRFVRTNEDDLPVGWCNLSLRKK